LTQLSREFASYASNIFNETSKLESPERRRSKMHDSFDASFDIMPLKRKLPLNTNLVEKGNFNIRQAESRLDGALINRHMFFPVKKQKIKNKGKM